jgi:serine phosphatase RsbU (regulator of sigma subunit)
MPAGADPYDRPVDADSLIIGRASSADVVVADTMLSRQHARIFRQGGELMVEDLGSRNGTRVNNKLVSGPTPLKVGDEVNLAGSRICIEDDERSSPEPARLETVMTLSMGDLQELQESWESLEGEAELRRFAERLKIVDEAHRALAGSASSEELLELILEGVFEHLAPAEAVIFLGDEDGTFQRGPSRHTPGAQADHQLYSRTLLHEVADKGRAALVCDTESDARFADSRSLLDAGIRSLLAAPLLTPEGCVGVIALSSQSDFRPFMEEDLELLTSLASVAALRLWTMSLLEEASERRRMEAELGLAREIQLALLPEELPQPPGFELYAVNTPSQGVSGDFYQIVERSEGTELALLVADVSGKGLVAALLTATVEALTAVPISQGLPADQSFRRVNMLLCQRTPPEKFATAFLAVLGVADGELSYASAGHNPALVVRASGEVEQLRRTGLPLGLMESMGYEAGEARLLEGDTLIVYTDGMVEAANATGEEYGLDRLIRVCVESRSGSAAEIGGAIEQDLNGFVGAEPFADDCTLVLLGRRSS